MPFALSPDRERKLEEILERYPTKMAATLPAAAPLPGAERVGRAKRSSSSCRHRLDVSPAHVQGVVTFYTLFNQKPVGKHQVWVCRTLPCALRGADDVLDHCEKKLGIHAGETTPDGKVTLRTAECLASCGTAPDDAGRQGLPRESHARPRRRHPHQADAGLTTTHAQAHRLPHADVRQAQRLDSGRLRARVRRLPDRQARAHDDDPRAGRRRGEEGQHPRPRRRRLPHGREVELHAQAPRGSKPALPRGQRRRGRAGHAQGPHADGAEPARVRRGVHHRLLRHRRARRVHLRARRAAPLEGPALGRHRRGEGQGLPRQDAVRQGLPGRGRTSTPAPARTSAAKRRRCSTRSRAARRAAPEAAVPGASRRVRLPDAR